MLISDKLKPYINIIIINKKISVLMIFNLIVLICSVGEKSVNRERKREREREELKVSWYLIFAYTDIKINQ